MSTRAPRPEPVAARGQLSQREADAAARAYWEANADAYQAEHGAFLAADRPYVIDSGHRMDRIHDTSAGSGQVVGGTAGAGFVWGPEGRTEEELGVLGPLGELVGARVLEVGCGAAQCSAWLAARGVRAVGVDLARNQLRHAPREAVAGAGGGHRAPAGAGLPPGDVVPETPPLVVATATALPFPDATFAAAFAAYGGVQFVADLDHLLAEVARVLRPGGRWTFSVTHPIRWAFPDDPGPDGLAVSGSYFDRTPYVERDSDGRAVYAEFHRTLGDYVAALVRAGFTLDVLVEPEWPAWNDQTWGGWSPLRGVSLPGTLILAGRTRGNG